MDDQPKSPDRRWPTIAIILIAVGVIFLFGEIFNVRFGSSFWPLVILVPGVLLLISAFGRLEVNPGLAGAGAVLTTLALIFFYQIASNNWESWAYIWALLPVSVGVSQMVAGTRNDDELLVKSGARVARTFGIVFAVGLVFFELIIFDRGGIGGYVLPLALVAVGGLMLWEHYRRGGTIPFADMFPRADAPGTPPPQPETPPPAQSATTPPPAAAAPPPAAARSASLPDNEHFPEDELPEPPAPDDAPFPVDEESPEPPPAAEPPKPKPRRRRTTTAKKPSSPPPPPPPPAEDS